MTLCFLPFIAATDASDEFGIGACVSDSTIDYVQQSRARLKLRAPTSHCKALSQSTVLGLLALLLRLTKALVTLRPSSLCGVPTVSISICAKRDPWYSFSNGSYAVRFAIALNWFCWLIRELWLVRFQKEGVDLILFFFLRRIAALTMAGDWS